MIVNIGTLNDAIYDNPDWVLRVLKDGVYEERGLKSEGCKRYRFKPEDVREVRIYTSRVKGTIGLVKAIEDMGYNVVLISSVGFYESFYDTSSRRPTLSSINKMFKSQQLKGVKKFLNFQPLFKNDYTDYKTLIGNIRFATKMVDADIDGIILNFGVNGSLSRSKKFKALKISDEEQQEIVKSTEDLGYKVFVHDGFKDIEGVHFGAVEAITNRVHELFQGQSVEKTSRNMMFSESYSFIKRSFNGEKVEEFKLNGDPVEDTKRDKEEDEPSFFNML